MDESSLIRFSRLVKTSNIRGALSVKLLDWAESVSADRFKSINTLYIYISKLKTLRNKQRERAVKEKQERQPPPDASIKLSRIVVSLIFEYEDFKIIKKSIGQLRSKDDRTLKTLEKIKNGSNGYRALLTADIGTIAAKDGIKCHPFDKVKLIAKPPKNVNRVSASYFRPTSSIAYLNFEFYLSDEVSSDMEEILNQEYLSDVIFKKFFKTKHFISSYITKYKCTAVQDTMDKYKNTMRSDFENWIIKNFNLKQKEIKQISFVDLYEVYGNPSAESELQEWKKDNFKWLECYGILRGSYHSDRKLYILRNGVNKYGSVHTLAKLEPHVEVVDGVHTDSTQDDIESIGGISALLSIMRSYGEDINTINGEGFDRISSWWQIWKPTSVVRIKKLKARIERYKNEFEENRDAVKLLILQLSLPKENILFEKEINLTENIVQYMDSRIKEMEKSIKILDGGLTEIISSRNTIAMFWLTLVVGIATIVGVYLDFRDKGKDNADNNSSVEAKRQERK